VNVDAGWQGSWSLSFHASHTQKLEDSALRIEEQSDATLAAIFRAHRMMLDGILSSGAIERELESLVGAETAVRRVFRRLHERFMGLKGPTLPRPIGVRRRPLGTAGFRARAGGARFGTQGG
jgi:hypothetical protein